MSFQFHQEHPVDEISSKLPKLRESSPRPQPFEARIVSKVQYCRNQVHEIS